jgi:hypothetical protein
MPPVSLASIPHVAEVHWVRGARAAAGAAPDVVLEVPHGATREAHYDALRAELKGAFPADLKDFFFVNTDVGAPEVARRTAERVVEAEPTRTALVIRCLLPRTFVDCNRIIAPDARPSSSQAGEMTPGIVGYVKEAADLALLLARHGAYRALVERAFEVVCGSGGAGDSEGGEGVMVHSYAPRSVDVPVDERIVERLRAAYAPAQIEHWPLRHPVDLITRGPAGDLLASERLSRRARAAFERAGLEVGENAGYSLHPSTAAHALALRHPGRTLCLELRRDLLAHEFTPFREMTIDPAKVERLATPLAEALHRGA